MHAIMTGEEVGKRVMNIKPLPSMWMATSGVAGVRPASGINCKPAVYCLSVSPCPASSDGIPEQPVERKARQARQTGIETDKQTENILTDRSESTMHTVGTQSKCQRKL